MEHHLLVRKINFEWYFIAFVSITCMMVDHQMIEDPQYWYPHYYDLRPTPHTHNDDQQSSHYQPLDTVTTEYTSMYTTPCTSAGKKGAPSVKIGDKEYAIVDPTRREEHTYAIPQ